MICDVTCEVNVNLDFVHIFVVDYIAFRFSVLVGLELKHLCLFSLVCREQKICGRVALFS